MTKKSKTKKPIPYALIECEQDRITNEEQDNILKASIAMNGLLQPIVLRETDDGKYKVLAGRRRFAALKSLYPPSMELTPDQYTFVPAEYIPAAGDDLIAATENLARLDMTAGEKVKTALALRKAYPDAPLKRLATACGCEIRTFKKRLKVGELPAEFLALLDEGLPLCKLEEFSTLPDAVREDTAPSELWDQEIKGSLLPEGGLCEECAKCPYNSRNADPDLFAGDEPQLCYKYSCFNVKMDLRNSEIIRTAREAEPDLIVALGRYLSEAQQGMWAWSSRALEALKEAPDNAAEYEEHEVLYIPDEGEPERRTMHFRPVDVHGDTGSAEPVPEAKAGPAETVKRELAAEEAAYAMSLYMEARKLVKARYRTIADFPEFTFERVQKKALFRLCNPDWHMPVLKMTEDEFITAELYEKRHADVWFIPLFENMIDRKGLDVLAFYGIDQHAWLDTAKMTCHPSKRLIELRERAKEMGI